MFFEFCDKIINSDHIRDIYKPLKVKIIKCKNTGVNEVESLDGKLLGAFYGYDDMGLNKFISDNHYEVIYDK